MDQPYRLFLNAMQMTAALASGEISQAMVDRGLVVQTRTSNGRLC